MLWYCNNTGNSISYIFEIVRKLFQNKILQPIKSMSSEFRVPATIFFAKALCVKNAHYISSESLKNINVLKTAFLFDLFFHSQIHFAMQSNRSADKSVCEKVIQSSETVFGQGIARNKCASTWAISRWTNEYGQWCRSRSDKGAFLGNNSERCQQLYHSRSSQRCQGTTFNKSFIHFAILLLFF